MYYNIILFIINIILLPTYVTMRRITYVICKHTQTDVMAVQICLAILCVACIIPSQDMPPDKTHEQKNVPIEGSLKQFQFTKMC